MPSLLKDRTSGRFGRLIAGLRPGRAGPLPVQTGFPTSLADLFVKNHGRLKKPSSYASAASKRKKRGGSVSPLPSSPSPSPPTPSPPIPSAAVPPSTQQTPAVPRVEYVCHTRGDGAFGLGLGFLALAGVVSLALLVIWSRTVVAAVTIAAFSLFLLESVRSSSTRRRARPPAATHELDLDGRGYVSPIREVEAAAEEPEPPRRSCSDSDVGTDIPILAVEESSDAGGRDSCDWKPKPKQRSWKRLIPRKLQKGRKSKDAESSGSFRSDSTETEAMVLGGNAKATDSRRGGRSSQADAEADGVTKSSRSSGRLVALDADARYSGGQIEAVDASADLTGVEDVVIGIRFPFVFVVVIVLLGLVGGRLPAVALTVLCSASVSWMQRLTRDGVNLNSEVR
ncbi:uncharacterized protein LOC100840973 [Brachypodium distachyon]|uniref:Uncharacterized protein n=1 Tax=Brachypodium distachyon TaxID=15368 RepID=I1GPT0_BRADI|nr:uncharacterized protein LOC100840973 [Brachypodium distachyon]KQK13879.1 hypothetical protein BRADI_1g13080v3 [Brachypodium distachyon]|eukprot:XP_003559613.1 uncharacterized protein LOC100840973 [Brachypodium distachyon]